MTNNLPLNAKIRRFLNEVFDDTGLNSFCFDYFPTVYDLFSQGMRKDEKITLLLDDCRRHEDDFDQILNAVCETFKDDEAVIKKVKEIYRSNNQESGTYLFENRKDDIERIFKQLESEPYLHLFGSSGIGKTYLVRQLQHHNFRDHKSAYIDLSQKKFRPCGQRIGDLLEELRRQLFNVTPSLVLNEEELITDLAKQAKDAPKYVLVILDNFDKMVPSVREKLRLNVLPDLQTQIADPTQYLRLIAVSLDEMSEFGGRKVHSFHRYSLGEFRGVLNDQGTYKSLLRQAVKKWRGEEIDPHDIAADNRLNRWANDLYDSTGGHPGAIEETLNLLGRRTTFSNANVFVERRFQICQDVLSPLLELQINNYFSQQPEHQNAFGLLWVFRYLSKGVFRRLLRSVKDNPDWEDLTIIADEADYGDTEKMPLWELLSKVPLLQSSASANDRLLTHRLAPIWRKLGNLTLQVTDPVLFRKLHNDGREVFDYFALEEGSPGIKMRIDCFIEGLYHLTQERKPVQGSISSEEIRHSFTCEVIERSNHFLSRLDCKDLSDEYLYKLNNLIERDEELCVELNQTGESDTHQQLLDTIKHHFIKIG